MSLSSWLFWPGAVATLLGVAFVFSTDHEQLGRGFSILGMVAVGLSSYYAYGETPAIRWGGVIVCCLLAAIDLVAMIRYELKEEKDGEQGIDA